MSFYVTKASGEKELFNENKFRKSLERSGANAATITQLLSEIKEQGELTSTRAIYRWALEQLKKENLAIAARYNLKQALLQLGPTGFPFEKYVAHLMRAQGYEAQTNQTLAGKCITHEVDLTFSKENSFNFAECKFHNSQALRTAVQVPLYVKARFDDVITALKTQPDHHKQHYTPWVITNTRFTSQALDFGNCAALSMLSWSSPKDNALKDLIDRYNVHPITALTTLSLKQKKQLIEHNFLLCKDIKLHAAALKQLGIRNINLDQVIAEAEGVCKL
ncbi:MAG: restriction endonuclease [Candidatus Babeliales bacterium]